MNAEAEVSPFEDERESDLHSGEEEDPEEEEEDKADESGGSLDSSTVNDPLPRDNLEGTSMEAHASRPAITR